MGRALYGTPGFYRRGDGPAAHFATSAQQPLFAAAVLGLARQHAVQRVIDLGAGRGELLAHLRDLDPQLELHAVEVAPRPPGLAPRVGWHRRLPQLPGTGTLLVAHEWLDTVPVDVVELTGAGPRLVLVDETGDEALGPPPDPVDLAWLTRWWPLLEEGDRAEVGRPRDTAWGRVARRLPGALLLAVDYATTREERAAGAYASGTLRAHRAGRLAPLVPDGSRDITAAVAIDAVRAAGESAGAATLAATDQRSALGHLLPPARTWSDSLAVRELTDRDGLGGFSWLLQKAPSAG